MSIVNCLKLNKAFTLLELLLVIAIIAVLAGIVMFALKPADRLREANQTKYLSNAKDIEKAISTYIVDNGGNLPGSFSNLTYGYYDICRQGQSESCVSLDALVPSYLPTVPYDTENSTAITTGFKVKYDPINASVKISTYNEYIAWAELNGLTLENELVGWWKMDENSWNGTAGEVKDSSSFNNNGVAVNSFNNAIGKYGNSANTSGTEVISVPNFDEVNGASEMTLSYWYYATSFSGGPVTNWAGGTQFIVYHASNGRLNVFISRNVGDVNTYALTANNVLSLNKWTNVQIIYDGNAPTNEEKLKAVVDGIEYPFISFNNIIPSTLTTVTGHLIFGDVNTTSRYNHFDGLIDEVRIYNRILNFREQQAIFNFAPKPVAYWKFDENLGTVAFDSSGNENTGTLINGPTWVFGKYGNAVSLDGINDFISVTHSQTIELSGYSTFSLWMKTNTNSFSYPSVIDKWSTTGTQGGYLMERSNSIPGRYNLYVGKLGTGYGNARTSISLQDGTWHHFAGVYNGSTITVYVDGILSGQNVWTGGIGGTTVDLWMGRDRYWNHYYTGYIDEVRIYNYARTQEQIIKDMNNN